MAEYINREELIENLNKFAPEHYNALINQLITKQPTADVGELKHGEWIKNKPNPEQMKVFHDMGIGKGMALQSIYWTCSCCGIWGTPRYKYCQECGAKMDGGNKE